MKIAYVCPMAHISIIEKNDSIKGQILDSLQCTKLNCGCAMTVFDQMRMDDKVVATHEFFIPDHTYILSKEEAIFIHRGYLLFREIPDQVPTEHKLEFIATEGMKRLAEFLANVVDPEDRLPDIVDTAIKYIKRGVFNQDIQMSGDPEIKFIIPIKPEDIN